MSAKPNETLKQVHQIPNGHDAILTYDAEGKPVEPVWHEADFIIGNPPFLGDKKMRAELGDKYVDDLRALYGDRIPGQSDLVCYWFEKARAMIEGRKLKRAGLLATQGIRGGANRKVLERIKQTGDVFWAQSDRDWILDGAAVHVSMIGFDEGDESKKELDGKVVQTINADLSSTSDLTSAMRLIQNEGLCFIGTQKTGPFELSDGQAQSMLRAGGNPNKRPNSDVIRPWVDGQDITSRPRNMWIIDFGTDTPIEEAAKYEKPFEYVRKNVKPTRDRARPKSQAEKWWLFARPRPAMRVALTPLKRYILTPRVSKHRVFVWVDCKVLPDSATVVIAREDDYFFGVLQSKTHELWSRGKGTQLREVESGFRYSETFTFDTFPFPWTPGKEPKSDPRVKKIALATRDLVEMRDHWLNPPDASESELKKRTLTNLYNERPTWLDLAHRRLDEAVLDAYGWQHDLSDDEILARLLALNLERAAKQK